MMNASVKVLSLGFGGTMPRKNKFLMPLIQRLAEWAWRSPAVHTKRERGHTYMKLDLSKLEKGEYVVSLIDMKGEVLQTEEMLIDGEQESVHFFGAHITTGTYLVHIFNRRTAASFSEKIVVL